MTDQLQSDPTHGPDPETAPYRLANRIQTLETRAETYATREWVWHRAFIALLAGFTLLATIVGIIIRIFT